jgi:hypothetical protein
LIGSLPRGSVKGNTVNTKVVRYAARVRDWFLDLPLQLGEGGRVDTSVVLVATAKARHDREIGESDLDMPPPPATVI